MSSKSRIRELRRALGLTQQELANLVGVSRSAVVAWERGDYMPEGENLIKVAKALQTSTDFILGTDKNFHPHNIQIYKDIIMVPLLSDATTACCGEGNGYEFPDETIEKMIPLFLDALGPIRTKGLFAIRVEGDSMTGAKIHDGDVVVVAPEEEPLNGSVVFVCYGPQKRWMIRWYYSKPNGTIILRAANREYPEIEITQEEVEMGWYTYVGKVVAIYGTPRAGI